MNDEVEMEKTIEEKRLVINKVQQDKVSMKPKIQSDCEDTTQTNIDFNTEVTGMSDIEKDIFQFIQIVNPYMRILKKNCL